MSRRGDGAAPPTWTPP